MASIPSAQRTVTVTYYANRVIAPRFVRGALRMRSGMRVDQRRGASFTLEYIDSVTDCDRKMARQNDLGGLIKLMMKLPVLRGELQIIYGHDSTLRDLSEAYNEATNMLALLRGNPLSDKALLAEYEAICGDIESDVLTLCSHWKQATR